MFRAYAKGTGSCPIVGLAYHKNTSAKMARANGVISDTLRANANGRKDDWESHLMLAEFAINNMTSVLAGIFTTYFIDREHTRTYLCPLRTTTALLASRPHIIRSGCGQWSQRCGSCLQ